MTETPMNGTPLPWMLDGDVEDPPLEETVMPFGPHQGKRFKDIPLRALDGAIGWMEDQKMTDKKGVFKMTGRTMGGFYKDLVAYVQEMDSKGFSVDDD